MPSLIIKVSSLFLRAYLNISMKLSQSLHIICPFNDFPYSNHSSHPAGLLSRRHVTSIDQIGRWLIVSLPGTALFGPRGTFIPRGSIATRGSIVNRGSIVTSSGFSTYLVSLRGKRGIVVCRSGVTGLLRNRDCRSRPAQIWKKRNKKKKRKEPFININISTCIYIYYYY